MTGAERCYSDLPPMTAAKIRRRPDPGWRSASILWTRGDGLPAPRYYQVVMILAAGFVALFGLLIVLTCFWALLRPQWLFELAKPILGQGWLIYLAVGVRIALGVRPLFP